MRLRFLTAIPILVAAFSAQAGRASTIAYDNAANISGLQNYGGSLGLDFQVNSVVSVTALGAFDNGIMANLAGHDGSSGITVAIFDIATKLQVGPSVTFSGTNTGVQNNGDAFLFLTAPIILGPGMYSIVAANDVNYNSYGTANSTSIENDGGGLISFVGTARYTSSQGSALTYPTTVDGGPANRYDAGTFQYNAVTPEPSSLVLLGTGLIGAVGVIRRRTV